MNVIYAYTYRRLGDRGLTSHFAVGVFILRIVHFCYFLFHQEMLDRIN